MLPWVMLSIAQGVVQAKEQSREEEEMIWKKRTQKMDVGVKTVMKSNLRSNI
jgi:hypothetical protein